MSHDADYNSLFDSETQVNESEDKIIKLNKENAALKQLLVARQADIDIIVEDKVEMSEENAALKAMVNALRGAIVLTKEAYKISQFDEALRVSELTPAQCLADVKADERQEGWMDGFTCTTRDYNGECFSQADILELAKNYISENKKP